MDDAVGLRQLSSFEEGLKDCEIIRVLVIVVNDVDC